MAMARRTATTIRNNPSPPYLPIRTKKAEPPRSLPFFTGGLLCAAVLYAGRFYKIFIMSAAFGNQVNLIALICTTL